MRIYPVNHLPDSVMLGKQTEYGVSEVRIDCAPWLVLWPNLSISVWVTPPNGAGAYPANTHMEGDVLVWEVSAADTATAGTGCMEVMGVADSKKKLSATTTTRVFSTITDTSAEPPEPQQAWVEKVAQDAGRAEGAAEEAASSASESAESADRAEEAFNNMRERYYTPAVDELTGDLSWEPNVEDMPAVPTVNIKGPKGEQGEKGEAGYTPVKDKDYFDGADGKDGVSPTVEAEAIEGGHRITITNADGTTKTADVMDGVNAENDELFIVRMIGGAVDRTYEEISAAVAEGRTAMLVSSTYGVLTYTGVEDRKHVFEQIYKPEGDRTFGFSSGLFARKLTVLPDGTLKNTLATPVNTPNPMPLRFTGAVNTTYDGSEPVTIPIPEGSGTGGSAEVEFASDDEFVTAMIENDLMIAVVDDTGVLADENNNIFEW